MLLKLTTIVALFLVWAPVAQAWSWPVQGPVLQPFVYDESHPYASGQHRGVDIGADAAGETVAAPSAGAVSFAGTVPTSGESVTIETADGYSVTLTHLGSILVAKGATVAEGAPVGTIGPSGTPEFDQPYVHLGIRTTSDPNGYLDPLGFLPRPAESGSSTGGSGSTKSQSGATRKRAKSHRGARVRKSRPRESRPRVPQRPRTPVPAARPEAQRTSSSQRPAHETRAPQHARQPQRHESRRPRPSQRPVVETAAHVRPPGLDAGHTIRPTVRRPQPRPSRARSGSRTAPAPLPLALNVAAALVALAAAFAAARRRSRRRPSAGAQILHLPPAALERRRAA